jgi:DivIVA domain-containing protein
MDCESIERRDFPTVRRGYDQAAVDAHLRAVATEVQEFARRTEGAGGHALGSATATQVQGILDAAQATAAEIEREARREAQRIREEAAQAAERAREHVETLARAMETLSERVQSLDGEVAALAESLRIGEGEPPATTPVPPIALSAPPAPASTSAASVAPSSTSVASALPSSASAPSSPPPPPAGTSAPVPTAPSAPAPDPSPAVPVPASAQPPPTGAQGGNDLDGARLVVLNMALGGESREQADRYLADSFQPADRERLLDEVYAAVGG